MNPRSWKVGLAVAALCFVAFHSDGANKLLILTEPTARGLAGKDFDRLLGVIRDEGNFPGGIIVREHARWARNWTNQDWSGLNRMSNDVAWIQPTHILIFGSLPTLVSGSHIDDGHEWRCQTSDNWLGCTNLTFYDSTNHTEMTGFDSGHLLNRNTAGDGRPDNTEGWFLRPVFRIDFAGVGQPSDWAAWTTGCTAGTNKTSALDEGLCLRAYITNDIAYRTGGWSNAATGVFTGSIWVGGAGDTDSKAATNFSSQLVWTRSVSGVAPGTYRVYYDNWDNTEVSNLWDVSCNPPRALICFRYRSYQMEWWWNYAAGQRAIGMSWNTPHPAFLVYAWTKTNQGVSGQGPDWVVGPSDAMVFDFVATSIARIGTGKIDFGRQLWGDGTIPLSAKKPRGTMTVSGMVTFN
jgi:hypothetical protein